MAVCVADLHLSDVAPVFRSNEPDWFSAMGRQLLELDNLAKCHGGVPVLCAGDVFHKWNPSPKLINFALRHLPHLHAVPGQHDLRHHNYETIKDTAYWTLAQAGKITNLKPGLPHAVGELLLWGFPWTVEPSPRPPHAILDGLHVAVIHRYVWTSGYCYPNAPDSGRYHFLEAQLAGYDAAVSGDNHLSFQVGKLANPGGFLRRHSDQRTHAPCAYLLHRSGKFREHFFDVSKDVVLKESDSGCETESAAASFDDFLEGLASLDGSGYDFRDLVYRHARDKKFSDKAMAHVRRALGD